MITRRNTLASFAVAAALALSGGAAFAEAPESFKVGYQKSASILVIARKQELLEKRLAELGVDKVEWVEFQFGPPLLEALGSGAVDIGFVGDAPPIFAQAAGANLVYVASTPSVFSGILVPEDSETKEIADLEGKRVALAKGSSSHNFTVQALKVGGLGFDAIQPSYLAPADAAAAFASGAVDAWTVWDPYLALAEQRHGARLLATSETDPALQSNSFYLANRSFAEAHPDVVDAALQEIAAATRWGAAHRDDLAEISAQATGVDLAAQKVAVNRYEIAVYPITEETLAKQQAIADAFFELGLIPKAIDVTAYAWGEKPNI
ncbi:MAG: sulfonate ABC transporter substrate-binding protein [Rhodovulum sulfidophilum]|uniref:Putative aliphatic sulfonates-binding protein n=1 Tax=Rhodovulum sulfidophilum TaxID=35806 RepID=A0A2W5N746_RHOSU|nr:MAG: sulfonate ABC transporter substrate-binding protein [Rhodovulum sulfidophilum]